MPTEAVRTVILYCKFINRGACGGRWPHHYGTRKQKNLEITNNQDDGSSTAAAVITGAVAVRVKMDLRMLLHYLQAS